MLVIFLASISFSLTLDEAFELAINGPDGPTTKPVIRNDINYSLELNSRLSTDNFLSHAELKGFVQIRSFNLTCTVNLKSQSFDARFTLPINLFKKESPKKPESDSLITLRNRVTNLFLTILDSINQLDSKYLVLEISQEEYEKNYRNFERGSVSFKTLTQSLEQKQKEEDQLKRFLSTYQDNQSEFIYLLALTTLPSLSYDYSLTFNILEDLELTDKELLELNYPIAVAEYELEQLKLQCLPQLSLDGTGNIGITNKYYTGMSLRYILVSSNQGNSEKNAQDKLKNAKVEREKKARDLLKEKKRLINEYNNEVLALESAKVRLKENQDFLELAEKAYISGLISEIDLKRARLALYQAEVNFKSIHHKCYKLWLAINGIISYQQSNPFSSL